MEKIKFLKDFKKKDFEKLFNNNDEFKKMAYNKAVNNYNYIKIKNNEIKSDNLENKFKKLQKILKEQWSDKYNYWDNHDDDDLLDFIIEKLESNEYMNDYYIKNDDYSKLYVLIPEHEIIYQFKY